MKKSLLFLLVLEIVEATICFSMSPESRKKIITEIETAFPAFLSEEFGAYEQGRIHQDNLDTYYTSFASHYNPQEKRLDLRHVQLQPAETPAEDVEKEMQSLSITHSTPCETTTTMTTTTPLLQALAATNAVILQPTITTTTTATSPTRRITLDDLRRLDQMQRVQYAHPTQLPIQKRTSQETLKEIVRCQKELMKTYEVSTLAFLKKKLYADCVAGNYGCLSAKVFGYKWIYTKYDNELEIYVDGYSSSSSSSSSAYSYSSSFSSYDEDDQDNDGWVD